MRAIYGLVLSMLLVASVALPAAAQAPETPELTAASWILYDATAGRVLAAHDADVRRPMASTTKMMTGLLALENATVSDQIVVSETAASIGGAEIGLVAGESVRLEDLLAALLLQSANDAAITIAEHVATIESAFVGKMNDRARALGMSNTSFANPHGLDAPNHYSSARDLLTLGLAAMQLPDFARLVGQTEIPLAPAPDGTERVAFNRNELIGEFAGAFGVKTGFTDDAGLVLVAAAERDGRVLYSVVMDSEDHFAETAALFDFGFESFLLFALLDVGSLSATAPVEASERRYAGALVATGVAPSSASFGASVVGPSAGTVGQTAPPGWVEAIGWPVRYWNELWGSNE